MKMTFDRVYIKVWFSGGSTCRNFYNVTEIKTNGNVMQIINSSGDLYLINWDNVDSIEEIYEGAEQ